MIDLNTYIPLQVTVVVGNVESEIDALTSTATTITRWQLGLEPRLGTTEFESDIIGALGKSGGIAAEPAYPGC